MKQKLKITTAIGITLVSLLGCATGGSVAPSQNESLNVISPSGKQQKAGAMQHSLDSWLKDDWEPTVKKDETIRKKYMKEKVVETEKTNGKKKTKVVYEEDNNKSFTLQEYVDKAAAYRKAHPNDYEHSNVKKLEAMPVIGK